MFVVVSLVSVVSGVALAALSDRFPAHLDALERGSGALMVGGLALLGYALPLIP